MTEKTRLGNIVYCSIWQEAEEMVDAYKHIKLIKLLINCLSLNLVILLSTRGTRKEPREEPQVQTFSLLASL